MQEEFVDKGNKKLDHFYNIITGNYKYLDVPWDDLEVEPDLIMTMRLP